MCLLIDQNSAVEGNPNPILARDCEYLSELLFNCDSRETLLPALPLREACLKWKTGRESKASGEVRV